MVHTFFDTAPTASGEAQAVFYVTRESVTRPPCLSSVESARSMRDPCLVAVLVRVCRHSLSETAALKTAVLVAEGFTQTRRCHPPSAAAHSSGTLASAVACTLASAFCFASSLKTRGSAET